MNTAQSSEPDWEKKFYDIMATIPEYEYEGMRKRLAQDLIDVTRGHQVGVDSEGYPYFLIRLAGEREVMAFTHAVDAVRDHDCPSALYGLWLLLKIAQILFEDEVIPTFSEEIQSMPDPLHNEEGFGV